MCVYLVNSGDFHIFSCVQQHSVTPPVEPRYKSACIQLNHGSLLFLLLSVYSLTFSSFVSLRSLSSGLQATHSIAKAALMQGSPLPAAEPISGSCPYLDGFIVLNCTSNLYFFCMCVLCSFCVLLFGKVTSFSFSPVWGKKCWVVCTRELSWHCWDC